MNVDHTPGLQAGNRLPLTAPSPSGALRRSRGGRRILMALAVVAMSAAGAHARDLCIDFAGGGTIVLKGFRIPGKNRCAPFGGFAQGDSAALSGAGCTSANGAGLTLHYSSHTRYVNAFYSESGTCRVGVPLPLQGDSGPCSGTYTSLPGGSPTGFYQYATFRYCDVNVPQ